MNVIELLWKLREYLKTFNLNLIIIKDVLCYNINMIVYFMTWIFYIAKNEIDKQKSSLSVF